MDINGLFIGLSTIDIQYYVDTFPQPNTKVKTNPPDVLVGGPATNAAVAFSFLGGNSFLASSTGKNSFSHVFEEDFENTGINHFDISDSSNMNPILASVVTSKQNGERNIFTSYPDDYITRLSPIETLSISSPDVILIDGFYPNFTSEIVKLAQTIGKPIILDGGSWKPQLSNLLIFCDYIICSENFYPPGCSKSDDVFNYLNNFNVKNIAITRGGKSVLYNIEDKIYEIEIENIKAEDTLGAGDFFHGAFAFYIAQNFSFKESLYKASQLATKTCQFQGTRNWLKKVNKDLFVGKKP